MGNDLLDPAACENLVSFAAIESAFERIRGQALRTPLLRSTRLEQALGAEAIYFKCENLQRCGSFKFRGAYNALSRWVEAGGREGQVLAYSSGNHAQALALSAALLGVRALLLMPKNAPQIKREAAAAYLAAAPEGSEIRLYDPAEHTREALAAELLRERSAFLLPPYDHPDVIAGQGSVAYEIFSEVGELDLLLVCCGGGGLLSGCALAAKAMSPQCKVVGVEPSLADDATRSFYTGVLQRVENPATIADGARTPSLGRYTFPLVLRYVDAMWTVSEEEIVEAMICLGERLKMVVEPTGALASAGLFTRARDRAEEIRGKRIGVVLSGGNVDLRPRLTPLLHSGG